MHNRVLGIEIPDNRIFGLDFLRAMAILQVVMGHGVYDLVVFVPVGWATLPLIHGGVTLFFVLSGYLIGLILIREFESPGTPLQKLRRFWIRRWFRTLPNYFLVLTLLLALTVLADGEATRYWWKYYLFIQNFMAEHPTFFPEAWSLSVEEWFYVLLPLVFLALAAFGIGGRRAWLSLIIATLVVSVFLRYRYYGSVEVVSPRWWDLNLRMNVVTRFDSLAFGVLGAYLHTYHADQWLRWRVPSLVVGIMMFLGYRWLGQAPGDALKVSPLYYSVFSFNLLSAAGLMTLPFMSAWHRSEGCFYRWVTLISITSYSMYLLHFSLIRRQLIPALFDALPELSGPVRHGLIYLAYWVLTILLSVLLYRFFEKPTTTLRSRFGD
jgi:peptidoglycan/LPS O-acetylase OafA/YrhL